MKLTERDQKQLAAALDIALNTVSAEHADHEALGWDWYKPPINELRWRCREIILEMIVKAGEPEEPEERSDE